MSFFHDSNDSRLTVLVQKCQHTNYNHRNNLQAQNFNSDSSDSNFNFSAKLNETGKVIVKNCGYKYIKGFQKTVRSVSVLISLRFTPYYSKNYTTDSFSLQVSAYCHYCQKNIRKQPSCEGNINNTEDTMKYKFSYGTKPKFTPEDAASFSRGKFECKHLMLTGQGRPVAVSHCTDPYEDYWRVEFDTCCIVFETEEDALLFCKVRFYDLNGKRLYRRPA